VLKAGSGKKREEDLFSTGMAKLVSYPSAVEMTIAMAMLPVPGWPRIRENERNIEELR
jgi:hypothetical protein